MPKAVGLVSVVIHSLAAWHAKMITAQIEEMINSSQPVIWFIPNADCRCLLINSCACQRRTGKKIPTEYMAAFGQATMLTEPHAGTDLGQRSPKQNHKLMAAKVTGNENLITGGEHDLTENIIHLVLAKLPDAPAGANRHFTVFST